MTDASAVGDSVDRDRVESTSDTAEPEQFSDANTFASRHAELARGYGGAEDPEDPSEVLAMPAGR
jgi:hypothetical protein